MALNTPLLLCVIAYHFLPLERLYTVKHCYVFPHINKRILHLSKHTNGEEQNYRTKSDWMTDLYQFNAKETQKTNYARGAM